jgi:hypothetical protein
MITYQSYNTKSPLNGAAARWAEVRDEFPELVPNQRALISGSRWMPLVSKARRPGS